jgi:Ser/Thr protein kinase RdoA (MazF antagonist)
VKIYDSIKRVFENETSVRPISVRELDGIPYSRVFVVETDVKPYIFKIYASSGWPENGKLLYVNRRLIEHGVPCAEILAFSRDNPDFPHGYLIEEYLHGTTADKLCGDHETAVMLHAELAKALQAVHCIKFNKYGYIGGGNPGWDTFTGFIGDNFKYVSDNLCHIYSKKYLSKVRRRLIEMLKPCDAAAPSLCHGDPTTKNAIYGGGRLTLIDYDDAHALPAVTDLARMVYSITVHYDEESVDTAVNTVLGSYPCAETLNVYFEHELPLKLWFALDFHNFYVGNKIERHISRTKAMLDKLLKSVHYIIN